MLKGFILYKAGEFLLVYCSFYYNISLCSALDMLQEFSGLSSDVSVIRRLTFAARYIDADAPGYLSLVKQFAFKFSAVVPDSRKVQIFLENLVSVEEEL